jgi:predicted alpha/beta superfamily hydrolase
MNDGQNTMDGFTSFIPNQEWQADETADRFIRAGLIPPLIIVGIDNGQMARGDEYLPTRKKVGENEMGGKADDYGRMLAAEVIPFINRTYRTKTGPSNTTLLGSSFGGIVSLYLGLKRPDLFGSIGVCSPSIWWDERAMLKEIQALRTKPPIRIWLDMGTKEGYDELLNARATKQALQDRGWKIGADLAYMEGIGAGHNERAWASRMDSILMFFYGTKEPTSGL